MPRLLLVDDDPVIRDIIPLFIASELGHTVAAAPDGESAWTMITDALRPPETAYAGYIIDLDMPHVGGIDLIQRIRWAAVPGKIIVFTGEDPVGDRGTLARFAIDALVLEKNHQALIEELRKLLDPEPESLPG